VFKKTAVKYAGKAITHSQVVCGWKCLGQQ